MDTRRFCFYLSDHGFGHVARSVPIVAETVRRSAGTVYVVCAASHRSFAMESLRDLLTPAQFARVVYRAMPTDVGLRVRTGTLQVDVPALTAACEAYLAALPHRAREEAEWLRRHEVAAAFCDMPLWSIEACRQAGVPLLYGGNFTWAELYREFLPESIWRAYAAEYEKLAHVLLYALHNREMMAWFANAARQETSITARPVHPSAVAALRCRQEGPLVFVALGMSAQLTQPLCVDGVDAHFITTEGVPLVGRRVTRMPRDTVHTQDWIAAADFVITKAGFSTVAECLMARRPMALFARDSVLEDRTTVSLLERQGLAVRVEPEPTVDMADVLERMRAIRYPAELTYYDAAESIAQRLLSL